jgi:glutaredoxin-like protein NrdH
MAVTVYTNPNCVQCEQTKRFLDKEHIEYTVENLQDPNNYNKVVEFINQGFKSAPIVVTDKDIWSGYHAEKLKGLLNDNN